MKTVIEMAREASDPDKVDPWRDGFWVLTQEELERFAALVRADERNSWPAEMEAMERQVNILTDALAEERDRMKWDVHSCGPTCKRYACVAMREAVEAEREACAKVAEDSDHVVAGRGYYDQLGDADATARNITAAIRARGSNT